MKNCRLLLPSVILVSFLVGAISSKAVTLTVSVTNDTGAGSFREALTAAAALTGTNTIAFAIPGTGPHTIRPATALPTVTIPFNATNRLIIDGYTQTNASPNSLTNGNNADLRIVLNGTNAGPSNIDGLRIAGSHITIRGLVINSFSRNGISKLGIGFVSDISVEGCFIGTDASGTNAVGNGFDGIALNEVNDCVIGGDTPDKRNVISGNTGNGILVDDDDNTVIQGNFIGTDKSGTQALGNGGHGILLNFGSQNGIVGGSTPGAGNVICANGSASAGFNFYHGVTVDANNSRIQGNFIGLDANGNNLIGNYRNGVSVELANSNSIGGINPGEGNVIAGNGWNGVSVVSFGNDGFTNAILGNSIYANANTNLYTGPMQSFLVGIELYGDDPDGVTPNDGCDTDTDGGNHLQNYPVLSNSVSDSVSVTISGSLNSASNTTYLLEFFASSQNGSSSLREGETFIGRTNQNGGANCANDFSFTFPVAVADGKLITATASRVVTNNLYETSEFSGAITNVGPAAPLTLTIISNVVQGVDLCLTWIASGGATNYVQSATTVTGIFNNISGPIVLPSAPQITTNYCDSGVLTNSAARFYRILMQ